MSVIDDIKARASIVEVAARYTRQMWPRGRTQVCRCLCGHNTDRNPSFTLYPKQNRFYCYACQRGGDVINLVELADPAVCGLAESHRRKEAVRALAAWYGIGAGVHTSQAQSTHRTSEPPALVESGVTEEVQVILEAATAYYENALTSHDDVMRYLTQQRGLTHATIKQLRIGYSDGQLGRSLSANRLDLGLAARVGLLTANGEKLRGRIIFPVMDAQSAPTWLIGRACVAGIEPKYDGLADGLVHKQPMMLGQAKRGIVMVEGTFDAAALIQWQMDAEWLVVALLGTGHRKAIQRLSHSHSGAAVVLLLDQDKAGKEAALKAAVELHAHGLQPRVILDRDRHTNIETWLAERSSVTVTSGQPRQKAQQEIAVVADLQARQWIRWVNWGGVIKDPGDLLMLGERGRTLLMQALE